jgi:maltose alpha-D-glucosyltransferase/alpha-amylase
MKRGEQEAEGHIKMTEAARPYPVVEESGPRPQWFKDAIIYQLHIKAFRDSDGDGVGDFKGLTDGLDYLHDLGVTALWLLPFSPSPLKDDGYDIADYRSIHPHYGTLRDFKNFLREAHRRGLHVITELVVNHTSDQHPWFQRARRSKPGSRWRDFYVWSNSPDRYKEARIIFRDFETSNWAWDPVAKAYYWHRFYSHQPDLNYDNPHVQKAVLNVLDHWFGMGVDGLRLDAVPYLFEREGTNCENLPETHDFLRRMRAHVDAKFSNRVLLAEANQWPEDAAAYFGNGDEAHMAFHFPLMPRMFMAIRMEDRFPITDILEQTPKVADCCQWAIFLRNHDELTLEMVTDEERDYMYRTYAQDPQMRVNLGIRRRLAPLLGNNRRRIELMSSLLCSMPGTPIIYYGDEIGMGDNFYLGDRNGVRTPMQWSADRNGGFSRANPQKLYLPLITDPEYHYETINVEALQANPQSLLWWMKRLFLLRKRYKAFSRGDIQFLEPDNYKILAFIRSHGDEHVLVVANLSRFVQYTELDLSSHAGRVPVELFGRTVFPAIKEGVLPLSLGPHGFYWFSLEPPKKLQGDLELSGPRGGFPSVSVGGTVDLPFRKEDLEAMERFLPEFLQRSRWFRSKARSVRAAGFREMLPLEHSKNPLMMGLVQVEYGEGEAETYLLPLKKADGEAAERVLSEYPQAVILKLKFGGGREGVVYDASVDPRAGETLLEFIAKGRHVKAAEGRLVAQSLKSLTHTLKNAGSLEPSLMKAEQTNTSIVYGKRFILKLVRVLEDGINPDLEIGRYLTGKRCDFVPSVVGSLEYDRGAKGMATMASLAEFVPNQGDAWSFVQDVLGRYVEIASANRSRMEGIPMPEKPAAWSEEEEVPTEVSETLGYFIEPARRLGSRTGELHTILASEREDPDFTPEDFSTLYQRSLYQSMRNLNGRVFHTLRRRARDLPESLRPEAEKVLALEGAILDRFRAITRMRVTARRVRCHGDYHLGQVLYTGKDFVIIDFEGEPARPLSERRIKRSPLRDVAGMLRSFQYAAYSALFAQQALGAVKEADQEYFDHCVNLWVQWSCRIFLKAYMKAGAAGGFFPSTREEFQMLLDSFLLEKAVYEMGYELNNRPEWLKIPFKGLLSLMSEQK